MSFRDETTTWVDNNFTSICEITSINSFVSRSRFGESNRFISAQLIWRETVMELAYLDLVRDVSKVDTGFLVDVLGTLSGHVCSDEVHR